MFIYHFIKTYLFDEILYRYSDPQFTHLMNLGILSVFIRFSYLHTLHTSIYLVIKNL